MTYARFALLTLLASLFQTTAQAKFEIRAASFRPVSEYTQASYQSGRARFPIFMDQIAVVDQTDVEKVDVIILNPNAEQADPKGYGLSIHLKETAGVRFNEFTSANRGKPMAILVNDTVISVPVIREPQFRQLMLSGYTLEEADALKKSMDASL